MTRRRLINFFILFFLILECQRISGTEPSTDTLIIGDFRKPESINSILTRSSISGTLTTVIFDCLVVLNNKLEPVSQLAERWEVFDNGKEWRFHLKKGIRFHNGLELTAKDITATYKAIKTIKEGWFYGGFTKLEKIITRGRYTVSFILKEPSIYFPFKLEIGIAPERTFDKTNNFRNNNPNYTTIGTGPYRLTKFNTNEIILSANNHYFEGKPGINTIKVKIFKNKKTLLAKLMQGEVDIVIDMPQNMQRVTKDTHYRIHSYPLPYYFIMGLNQKNELFRNRLVRKALNYAINKKEIIERVLGSKGIISSGTIYPESPLFHPGVSPYPYNPKLAITLLQQAGWRFTENDPFLRKEKKIFEFELLITEGDTIAKQTANYIEEQLLEIGVKVKTVKIDATKKVLRLFKKQYESLLVSSTAKTNMENNFEYLHSSQITNGLNFYSYKNPTVDRLLEAGRMEMNTEKRKQIAFSFQQELFSDPPGVFLFWRELSIAVNKRVQGTRFGPGELFGNIHEWFINPMSNKKQQATDTRTPTHQ